MQIQCLSRQFSSIQVLLLLHSKADPNLRDCDGMTALHSTVLGGHLICAKALLYYDQGMRMIVALAGWIWLEDVKRVSIVELYWLISLQNLSKVHCFFSLL